jgi:hypothetical protein
MMGVEVRTRRTLALLSGTAMVLALLAFGSAIPSSGSGYPPTSVPGSPDVAPGTAVATVGGNTVTAKISVTTDASETAVLATYGLPVTAIVTISAGSAGLGLASPYAASATFDPNNSIVTLGNGVQVDLAGYGLMPGTIIDFYLYSAGASLGSTTVAANGTYSYTITIPSGISQGSHTLAAKGTAKNDKPFKLSVGVKIKAPKTFTVGPFVSGYSVSGSLSAQVQELADLIKDQHKTHVVVTGYSDSTGSAASNQAESVDRAKSVATQLSVDLRAGKVKDVKIVSRGAGSSHPVVSNKSAKKRVLNRRVVATLS